MSTIDSHCHPQFLQYDKDREEMIKRAKDAGVSMICVGTDLETSKQGIELAQKYDGMWASVGLHPNDIGLVHQVESSSGSSSKLYELYELEKLLTQPRVVAIGEVGLDYYRTAEPHKQRKQKEIFEQFLDLAIKNDKPLILHFRDSPRGSSGRVHKDAIEILDSRFKILASGARGVSHSFTGNLDEAKKYLNRGMYLGFNGIITFARQYDEVVRYTPLEQILLETDAPFLAPEPYRGQRNESAYVIEVAKKIAELKNESLEKIIEQTTKNCRKLFNL